MSSSATCGFWCTLLARTLGEGDLSGDAAAFPVRGTPRGDGCFARPSGLSFLVFSLEALLVGTDFIPVFIRDEGRDGFLWEPSRLDSLTGGRDALDPGGLALVLAA
jgi:hypothetical protein